jgi:hypothetical protein
MHLRIAILVEHVALFNEIDKVGTSGISGGNQMFANTRGKSGEVLKNTQGSTQNTQGNSGELRGSTQRNSRELRGTQGNSRELRGSKLQLIKNNVD